MKIVHIAPSAPYMEGWGFQENLLPKYQKNMGHDVTLITTGYKIQLLRGLAIIAVVLILNCPASLTQVYLRSFLNFSVGLFLFKRITNGLFILFYG